MCWGSPTYSAERFGRRRDSHQRTMKLAAVKAIANLAKEPVPSVVNAAYGMSNLKFGRDYIPPKPLDPRLITAVSPAVARGAMESGVARRPITDWEAYNEKLRHLMGYDNKFMRRVTEEARRNPKRVVFGEANTDIYAHRGRQCLSRRVCIPILLGNEEMIEKRAKRLGLDIEGHRDSQPSATTERPNAANSLPKPRRITPAQRSITRPEALELMFDRNYFGMMMVETGQADAMISGHTPEAKRLQR